MLAKDVCCIRKAYALRSCHQILLSHDLCNRHLRVSLETEVTVCDNTHEETVIIHHRNTSDMMLSHHSEHLTHSCIRMNCNRIVNHSVLSPLDTSHLIHLLFYGHILMNDTDTAGTRHGNSEFSLSHSVHSR